MNIYVPACFKTQNFENVNLTSVQAQLLKKSYNIQKLLVRVTEKKLHSIKG